MFHPKISSPLRTPQGKKRPTNSGRSITGSAKKCHRNIETPPAEPVPVRYSDIYKREKAQSEMGGIFRKKNIYPIAPDANIPNSICRTIFKPKYVKPVEIKAFEIRMDLLNNLQNKDRRRYDDEDDDWTELDDPDPISKLTTSKTSNATFVSRTKKTNLPDLFKRLQEESWWKQPKDDQSNLQSILVYLYEIIKSRQTESYESACYYIVEIFRTYGIDSESLDKFLKILLQHLTIGGNDQLNICTIRTIAQFMIERKDIIVGLLESARKCSPNDPSRLEIINSVKFITDVNHSDEIELVLEHMSAVYDSLEEDFSLKMIIKGLEHHRKVAGSNGVDDGEDDHEIHPLLKKISEERWFPRSDSSITLDYVLDVITSKLFNAGKALIKTLTTHLIQLHHVIGYNKELFDRAASGLILLLTHAEPDHRQLAASTLASLNQETKAVDLALLNYFVNDARVLVRTECGETLKKLTGITMDTVLQDCANEIPYLETLPEENFSLQNYLREKNRLPTPPPMKTEKPISPLSEDEKEEDQEESHAIDDNPMIISKQYETKEAVSSRAVSPPVNTDQLQIPMQTDSAHFSQAPSVTSTVTPVQSTIRVEISGKRDVPSTKRPRSRLEQPEKTSLTEQINQKRSSLVPNNTNMWDSYIKQNDTADSKDTGHFPPPDFPPIKEEQPQDFIQTLIEEHKRTVGYYRIRSNRRILIPHKISMENILADQSHIIVAQYSPPPALSAKESMSLSNLQHNRQQLNEIEFVQLLSSLVIRSIQVHRQYEKFVPGLNSPSFVSALSVSPAALHESFNGTSSMVKLPSIIPPRPTGRQFAHIQSNMKAKAAKEGINVSKAHQMESALSTLLKSKRESIKSTTLSSSTSHFSSTRHMDVTHAWFLVRLLRAQGISHSENYLQQIIQTYPKFIPILNTRIPQNLLPLIWNDPVTQQLAAIFSNRQDQSNMTNSSIRRGDTKPSFGTIDDDSTIDALDYSTLINRVQSKKRFLPIIRGFKVNPPHHVVKFGYREIDVISPEPTSNSLFGESAFKSRKRRVCMHLMMPTNETMPERQESTRSHLSHIVNTEYSTTAYMPFVTRPPMCH